MHIHAHTHTHTGRLVASSVEGPLQRQSTHARKVAVLQSAERTPDTDTCMRAVCHGKHRR